MARKNSRNASGSGSIRRRPNGSWEARYVAGYDPGTGKMIRRSVYGKTQKEVREKLRAITASLDAGTYQTPHRTTVAEWLTEWLEVFCASSIKPLTLASYDSAIRNHLIPHLGAIRLQELRGTHVQRMINDLTEKGLSPKTIRNITTILHRALATAMKQGLTQINACDMVNLPKGTKPQIKPLSDAEIPLFLSECEASPFGNAYALCLFAGLREGECLGLPWEAVDFEHGRITVAQQLQKSNRQGSVYYIAPTKNSRVRVIAPPPIAFDYLRNERAKQSRNRLAAGPLWDNPWGLVFTDETGEHYKIATFYNRFKRIAAKIGRPDARPHDLRHTAATVAIASGADIKSVQHLLGHATASFTLDVYAHASEKMMEDTAARMQAYYDQQKKHG